MMSKPPSTQGWNPQPLLKRLYYVPDAPKMHRREVPFINIEGYLEKLPSGRKKATFWNAWKRRYFVAKDGILFYYQNNQSEKPNMKLPLIGGKIEIMDPSMISVEDGGRESRSAGMLGIDDGKGHYVVVRCPSRQEAERWKEALESHTYDDFTSQYIQPWPRPTNPTLLRDTLVIDIGSCSVRAGVLASQPTLPQVFFPSVVATNRETKAQIWGIEALMPDIRSTSSISFPIRPSHKISKAYNIRIFSVDLNAVSSLLQKTFNDLKVDPKNYNIQLSVPRVLNPHTQAELLKILFDKYGVKSVNMTHQSILALYAYNATSGIIVDIGERLDVVPVIDGYIVDGGVSRVPYGGYRITDHLRQFLFQKNISLINDIDSYIIRMILESICYCAQHYNTEKQRCTMNPENFEKLAPLAEVFSDDPRFDTFRDMSPQNYREFMLEI
ncbi:putative actin-26 [Armadillidium nasatum]|uniref:Putative actin-26 n=1 Tax=Armadillidium nasatum TaxID=96803 RepID=A0A5N5TFV8_9CRUS|nr:putative actin-26 [Armadillidium nasatum]